MAPLLLQLVVPPWTGGYALSPGTGGRRRTRRRPDRTFLPALSQDGSGGEEGGIYRPFAEYAWGRLAGSGLLPPPGGNSVPEELRSNLTPSKGPKGGAPPSEVRIAVDAMPGRGAGGAIRLARYALLETVVAAEEGEEEGAAAAAAAAAAVRGGGGECVPGATHVLNLVVFPNPNLSGCSALPVLGLDLVTLPGGRHLVAMDLQPVLPPPPEEDGDGDGDGDGPPSSPPRRGNPNVIPERYQDLEARLASLHQRYCSSPTSALPWGGDLPPFARRYFSPYAVWTRLGAGPPGGDAPIPPREPLDVVRTEVYGAFRDYVDLYLELMGRVQDDLDRGDLDVASEEEAAEAVRGQRDYLNYRKENDPARPMLKGLYGEDWTERLIGDVLFPMI